MFSVMARGDIGKRIREVRETYGGVGMKQGELAQRTKISQGKISNWERGENDPKDTTEVNRIADALKVSPDYLLYGSSDAKPSRLNAEETGRIKVYGPVSAGDGNTQPFEEGDLEVPIQFARQDYGALKVEGDSMLEFLHDRDVVIFKDWPRPKPNAVMAVELPGPVWVVKKVIYDSKTGTYILRSLNPNPAYEDITGPMRFGGFLVGFVRDDGPERLIRLNPYGLSE